MSSSIDAGYHASEAAKEMERSCPKGGEHDWIHHDPKSPSHWKECRKCKRCIYFK